MTEKHHVTELQEKEFEDFVKKGVVVVDFWAEWCGPCKIMGPIFDEVAGEMKGKAKFGKVDVDVNQDLAQEDEVMSIPTTILFKNGEQRDRFVGVIEKEELIEKIEDLI